MPEERKLVTILFADITGSTTLGERFDPEDMRALIGRYYKHVRRVIADYGGTLEKFIGDAAMAVFGLPHAHGNDPERALAAALALRAAVAGDPVLADLFALHIGVNTGEVVATAPSADVDSLVTGDTVNTAARIYAAAAPGEILVGERTHAAAEAAFRFGRRRLLRAKNKRQPVPAYPLIEPRPARQMGRPPFVGRKQDLLQLNVLWGRALEERRPQLISIVAPAGTGKTRLIEEFLARLDPADNHQVSFARCPPYGQTLVYWPLRGLLEGALGGVVEPDGVASVFAASGHGLEESARLAGLVLTALGIEGESQSEREAIFHAWRLLIEALATQAPRVIVFEDLHWASESLLDLVEHIMSPRTRASLLIIATSRPELLDRRPMWGGGRSNFSALALEPLSAAQTQELVGLLAAGVDEAVRAQIVERAGGNPFFAIELARGAAARRGDAASTVRMALPDSVHEAVLARLDQLAPHERTALQAAAVAGRTFRPATLRAMLVDRDPAAIDTALDALVARDLVEPSGAGSFTFRHILFRDVAYGTLTRAERVRLHVAVADWLESFAAGRLDEYVELIAYHYREAAQLARQSAVPLALPVDPIRAVYFLERAGEVAARSGAPIEARARFENAIALAPPGELLQLYEKMGECLPFSQAGLEAYSEALNRWRAQPRGDPLVGARLLRRILISRTRWQGGMGVRLSEGEMEALRDEARRLAEKAGDEYEQWRVKVIDLFWPFWRGAITADEIVSGQRIGPAAAAYFETRGDWEALSETLDGYSSVLFMSGEPIQAAEALARRLASPGLSRQERGDAVAVMADAWIDAGDYSAALRFTRQTLHDVSAELPRHFTAHLLMSGVRAAWLLGEWAEAGGLAAAVLESWEEGGRDSDARIFHLAFFPALHIALAQEDRASADQALAAIRRLIQGEQDPHAWLLDAYLQDDPQALLRPALSVTLPAVELSVRDTGGLVVAFLNERGAPLPADLFTQFEDATRMSGRDWIARTLAIARALAGGDSARLAAAIDDAEAHGLIPHAARMRIVLAQREGDRTQLERARPTLERLGDRQFLRRLDEVAATLR
jgi:class 3 adenylate cyclase